MATGIGIAGAIVALRSAPAAADGGFLAGWALALGVGAALAVAAAAASLAGARHLGAGPRAPRREHLDGGSGSATMRA